jgi:hypothetical protein
MSNYTMTSKSAIIIWMLFYNSAIFSSSTIATVIPTPKGYTRLSYPESSYSYWVQNLPLKNTTDILTFDGSTLYNSNYSVWAVVNMPLLFSSDIEQCADYAMRFYAEYHKEKKRLDSLYLYHYSGKKFYYVDSGLSYRKFLQKAFTYSNSYSLKVGSTKVKQEDQLSVGDMLIQNQTGGIGHVSIIVDICKDSQGNKLYLIGYSFMPAQEFHIEKANNKYGKEGWFTLKGYRSYLKEYLPYGEPVYRRF